MSKITWFQKKPNLIKDNFEYKLDNLICNIKSTQTLVMVTKSLFLYFINFN